jgi:small ligand-binding sensory domain FIST
MTQSYATVAYWNGGFDEAGLQAWAEQLRSRLHAPRVSFGLLFTTPGFFAHAAPLLELLRVHAQIPLLVGCSSTGLIVDGNEWEERGGLVLGLYHLPGAELKAWHFTQEQVEEYNGPGYWHVETGLSGETCNGWLVFADPYTLDAEDWVRQWNEAFAPRPILGGLASGNPAEGVTQVYLNGEVYENGAVALALCGEVELRSVISQGCTPIGDTWIITRVERNFIEQIANRPAYQVLVDTFNELPAEEQRRTQGNLFVGLAIDEYKEQFQRGDFLVRNLIGADPASGVLAVGALPRPGQTLQFQRRDAAAAREDLRAMLARARQELAGATIYGGCLCCCNGRGRHLFGEQHHDARMVQDALGPFPLAGFFCNGELGPVGGRNFVHGYTASLALFVKPRS